MRTAKRVNLGVGAMALLWLGSLPAGAAQQRVAQGTRFMVAAPTPEAVQVGVRVLEEGGNAVDAAAAVAFALVVTDPAMASLGGRSQILLRLADGRFVGIDGATQAPLGVDEPARVGHGYRTVPIPGTPAALEQMLAEYGTLSLAQVLEPAIRLAEEGFVVKEDLHEAFRRYQETLVLYPGTRRHFFKPDGSPYSRGERFVQPALARTLRILAREGTAALYRGELARSFVSDMQRNGGLVTLDDLARYRPRAGEIVEGSYRGYRVVARGGNCDGASVIQMLQMLEHFPLARYRPEDPEYIHILAQVLYLGRIDELVPDWIQVSPAHAARRVREIDLERVLPMATRGGETRQGETHHFSVVDSQGNAVAITQSIGPQFGAKAASPELGFFYGYSYDMNDDPVPFKREKTEQSPTMVLAGDRPFLVLGAAGSGRIPGAVVRTVVNVVDHGMTLEDALAAPRWFWAEDGLRMENLGLGEALLDRLRRYGYEVRLYEGRDPYFGSVHAVFLDPATGVLYGAGDPRDHGGGGGR